MILSFPNLPQCESQKNQRQCFLKIVKIFDSLHHKAEPSFFSSVENNLPALRTMGSLPGGRWTGGPGCITPLRVLQGKRIQSLII